MDILETAPLSDAVSPKVSRGPNHLVKLPRFMSRRSSLNHSHRPETVFDVITDIDRYSEFVPWCVGSHVLPQRDVSSESVKGATVFYAELTAGFLKITESYTSKVTVYGSERVEAEAVEAGLFHHLRTVWTLTPTDDGGCTVEFSTDFEFKSQIYAYFANIFFMEVSKGVLGAFEARCAKIEQLKHGDQ